MSSILPKQPDYKSFQCLSKIETLDISSVSLTPDGQKIVGQSRNQKKLTVWDAQTGAVIRTLTEWESVKWIRVTKNGQIVISFREDGTVVLQDLESDRIIGTVHSEDFVFADWVVTPDGQWLAGRKDDMVKVWQTQTGELVHTITLTDRPNQAPASDYSIFCEEIRYCIPYTYMEILPDGSAIAVSYGKWVKLYFLDRDEEVVVYQSSLEEKETLFGPLRFGSNGDCLIGTHRSDAEFRVWYYKKHKHYQKRWHSVQHRRIACVDISQDGQILVSSVHTDSQDFLIKSFDLLTGAERGVIRINHQSPITDIATNIDGTLAATYSGDRSIRLWNLFTGQCLQAIHSYLDGRYLNVQGYFFLGFAADNQTIIIANQGIIRLWRGHLFIQDLTPHKMKIRDIALSPNREKLICSIQENPDRSESTASSISYIQIWSLATKKVIKTCEIPIHTDAKLAMSHDEQIFFYANFQRIEVISISGERLLTIYGPPTCIMVILPCPDLQTMIIGTQDGQILVWNYKTGERIRQIQVNNTAIRSLVITPNQQHLISASDDGSINVWDLQTGNLVRSLIGHTTAVHTLSLTGDGKTLMSSSVDGCVNLWDWHHSQPQHTFDSSSKASIASAMTLDGAYLVHGFADQLQIWGVPSK
ncbi:WD40 repeat domain-containing protein [Pseudanabaena sp. Chao 1811]|uniref:WD40 repeat domain-containing protein n=1 Tax=Pseudanabaena sp. Chao 1811 TaxID=2963092 RepID=UPI0022F38AC0|nr:hypothetical protein [Pseudanabaena sp. Chao 1811]